MIKNSHVRVGKRIEKVTECCYNKYKEIGNTTRKGVSIMKVHVNYNYNTEESPREAKSREIAYQAACEGVVLLENKGVLPLEAKEVALFGYGAAHTVKGGSGSGDVNERHSISILEGMEAAGYSITSMDWIRKLDEAIEIAKKNQIKDTLKSFKDGGLFQENLMKIVGILMGANMFNVDETITDADIKAAATTDTAIYVASRQAGEGADRKIENGDNDLSDTDIQNLQKLTEAFAKVVLVINVGCSLNMDFLQKVPNLGAVLFYAQQGQEGGRAFADIVSGKVNPSGKLTDTWAKKYEHIPFYDEFSYLNGDLKEEYYKEGLLVGYRYFDAYGVEPQYPFGYGLSYTTFQLETESVTEDNHVVTIRVKVTNTGTVAGKEVVQVYQSAPNGILKKEVKSLVGFGKTQLLQPGESEIVEINYNLADTASYQELGARWILDKGNYVVRVGNSSVTTTPVAVLALDDLAVVEQAKNICPVVNSFEELELKGWLEEDLTGLPVIPVSANSFETIIHDYTTPAPYHDPKVDAFMEKLTLKEKAAICVGSGMGDPARFVQCKGSVGHSSVKLLKKGLPNLEMCDGPAGLRINRTTGVAPNGKSKMTIDMMGDYSFLPDAIKKAIFADPVKDKIAVQYATAWPVSIAQAQTWNTELVGEIGLQVGEEMKEFLCSYWLAPGVNIHRNPLCGRNFEYYSEDPVLTGKLAAALIQGVQATPGNYVSMKHYACNNQEDARMGGNVNVTERTLREIYLKGFGIAVKEAKATGVMSSYNKINGVPASNSYDILTTVLRNEWGFDGVVMSDWFGTIYSGKPGAAVKAGNDLSMPGLGIQEKMILAAVKMNLIYEKDVDRAARNIVRQCFEAETTRKANAGETMVFDL